MPHACEDAFQTRIGTLRNASFNAELEQSGAVQKALFCDIDPQNGKSRMQFLSTPGLVFSLDAQIEGTPRWAVLRLELGKAAFLPGDVLGLVVKGAADRQLEIRPFLRMVRDGRLADTRFDDPVTLGTAPGVSTALHTLSAMDPACGAPGHCALVLGLPTKSTRLQIDDMSLFLIPAVEGLRSTPTDFASFSV